jgi:hypothetical protein
MSQPRFQLVPGSRLGVGTGVGWRLLGANNRELGRSAGFFADAEDAVAAIDEIRTLAASAEAHIVHDSASGLWAWQVADNGLAVAVSGRGFRHERECRYNLEQFRSTAPVAPASQGAVPTEFPWQRTISLDPVELEKSTRGPAEGVTA